MDSATASRQPGLLRALLPAVVCAAAGAVVFQFFGNATRGYIDTQSVFYWWGYQWCNPSSETEHGWLILALSGWLLWRSLRSEEWRVMSGEIIWLAAAAMVAGLAFNAAGFVAQQTRLGIVGLLVFTWGVLALGGGRRWGRAAVFPLGFMLFAIPVNVLDTAGFWLRMWVVNSSAVLAHAVGIDVVRSGTQLLAPDGRFQYDVAAACSGVRSLAALAALSLLLGYLNFKSAWRRGLILLLCLPLTYLGNLARISSIVLAAHWGGEKWGARAHEVMGYGVFIIVLGGVLGAAALLRRLAPEPANRQLIVDNLAPAGRGRPAARWLVAAVIVALAAGETGFLARFAAHVPDGGAGVRLAPDGINPVELPAFLGTEWIGQRVDVSAVEREILPADTGFSRRSYVQLANRAHRVFLSVVLSGRDRTSIHRPELCLVGQGWTIRSAGEHRFTWPGRPSAGVPATVLRTERSGPGGKGKTAALVAYWFVSSDAVVATHWERFLHDAWKRLRHGEVDRWAYVLLLADADDGESAALARMQAVLDETLPVLQKSLPVK